jgi:hypothetical protein
MTTLAPVLQAFFTERLMAQRRASSQTITGYRDTLRLLVGFACAKTAPTWTRHWSPPSSTTWKLTGTTRCGPATGASPPSTRCSATPHCTTPNAPPSSSGS